MVPREGEQLRTMQLGYASALCKMLSPEILRESWFCSQAAPAAGTAIWGLGRAFLSREQQHLSLSSPPPMFPCYHLSYPIIVEKEQQDSLGLLGAKTDGEAAGMGGGRRSR